MPTVESLQDADDIISEAIANGKVSRARLRLILAEALDTASCRVCGNTIGRAALLDRDSLIDRQRRTVAGRRLAGLEWQVFEYLFLRGSPASWREFIADEVMKDKPRDDPSHNVRVVIWQLRRKLNGTPFAIVTHCGWGRAASYELIRRAECPIEDAPETRRLMCAAHITGKTV